MIEGIAIGGSGDGAINSKLIPKWQKVYDDVVARARERGEVVGPEFLKATHEHILDIQEMSYDV